MEVSLLSYSAILQWDTESHHPPKTSLHAWNNETERNRPCSSISDIALSKPLPAVSGFRSQIQIDNTYTHTHTEKHTDSLYCTEGDIQEITAPAPLSWRI